MRRIAAALSFCVGLVTQASAADIVLPAVQVGGFYASGGAQNLPSFQNYFVGYGTTPGFPRTPERRSFFVFDVPPLPSGVAFKSATLSLRLPFGGLIYGKGPGVPGVDPIEPDPTEAFSLGLLPVSPAIVLSPTLTLAEGVVLFGLMDDIPVASPTVFMPGIVPPDPGDGGPPIVKIALDGGGLAALNTHSGGKLVLAGWMPTWSEDLRLDPSPPPVYFEASELIFGLTDVHVIPILNPKLEAALGPVPELPIWLLWPIGGALIARRGLSGFRPRVGRCPAPE